MCNSVRADGSGTLMGEIDFAIEFTESDMLRVVTPGLNRGDVILGTYIEPSVWAMRMWARVDGYEMGK